MVFIHGTEDQINEYLDAYKNGDLEYTEYEIKGEEDHEVNYKESDDVDKFQGDGMDSHSHMHSHMHSLSVKELGEAKGNPGAAVNGMPLPPWGIDEINDNTVDGVYGDSGASRNGGKGVHIYVVDTGVRTTHEQFEGRAIPTIDTTSGRVVECDPADTGCADDKRGHGTHVAGTAGGRTVGVAWKSFIHAVKVINDDGIVQSNWLVEALDWIASNAQYPAVVSMSLAFSARSKAIEDAADTLERSGLTVVVAAGNEAQDSCFVSPAMIPNVITVSASNKKDKMTSWSNFGECVDVQAPGTGILSCAIENDQTYSTSTGTSMAAPHVTGSIALLLSKKQHLTAYQVRSVIMGVSENMVHNAPLGTTHDRISQQGIMGTDPGAAHPPPTPTPPFTAFQIIQGDCKISGADFTCIESPEFPDKYPSGC